MIYKWCYDARQLFNFKSSALPAKAHCHVYGTKEALKEFNTSALYIREYGSTLYNYREYNIYIYYIYIYVSAIITIITVFHALIYPSDIILYIYIYKF